MLTSDTWEPIAWKRKKKAVEEYWAQYVLFATHRENGIANDCWVITLNASMFDQLASCVNEVYLQEKSRLCGPCQHTVCVYETGFCAVKLWLVARPQQTWEMSVRPPPYETSVASLFVVLKSLENPATSCTCKRGVMVPWIFICCPLHYAPALLACHLFCADTYLPGAPLFSVGDWTCNVVLILRIHPCGTMALTSRSIMSVNHPWEGQCQ